MGGGRLPGPLGVHDEGEPVRLYDDDALVCRPGGMGEAALRARGGLAQPSGSHALPGFSTPEPVGVHDPAVDVLQCRVLIDPLLRERNRAIERALLDAAEAYLARADLRWFFAYAHGMITKQINENLSSFREPNALLTLNIHFAEEFIRAIDGQGHEFWVKAFHLCAALQKSETALLMEAEMCGAAMANVHIHVDLANALRHVGCIPSGDYADMLVFVNRGSLAALVRLRGKAVGAGEAMLQQIAAPMMNLEVKAWRNAVFEAMCKSKVPDPTIHLRSRH
jgi:hypothetical protein